MQATLLLVLVLVVVGEALIAHSPLRSNVLPRMTRAQPLVLQGRLKDEPAPANESEEQMRERMKRKARKMMFNENGVAYAPWVAKQINEDAIVEELIRKERGQDNKKAKASILERGEIQGSDGMRWRMSPDGLVQLAWTTGGEAGNKGFIVEKKSSSGGEYVEIASFKDVAQLVSKGASGGKYSYTDPATATGTWIYRVTDCDEKGKKDVLCQCFTEVTTETENKAQAGVLVGFLGVLGALAVAGVALNPQF